MKNQYIVRWLLLAAAALMSTAHAEDIDIFQAPTYSGATNVLVAIDSAGSTNANTLDLDGTSQKVYTVAGHVIQALLDPGSLKLKKSIFPASSIVTTSSNCTKSPAVTSGCTCASFGYDDASSGYCKLTTEKVTKYTNLVQSVGLGVMLFTGQNANGSSSDKGGYVAYKVMPMSDKDNRDKLAAKLNNVPTGSESTYSMAMYEAYKYFTNGAAANGFGGNKAYSATALEGYDRRACGNSGDGSTGSCATTATYTGPITADSCNNAIIVIGPGSPSNGKPESDATKLAGIGGTTTIINAGSKDDSNLFDEYARFFISKDFNPASEGVQGLSTYTIMNDPSPSTDAVKFMQSAATQGGGSYFAATNAVEFLDAFVAALGKVQSVNSAFASVALPVSVNVRGTNLNQVYVGMFRPDKDGKPRWYGNMKEYQLALQGTEVVLADADGVSAESNSDQLLKNTARSFWTHDSAFWNFSKSGDPVSGSDNPDGSVVEKGGAAQMAREQYADTTLQGNRGIFTCIACAAGTVLNDPANASTTAFKATNAAALAKVSSPTTGGTTTDVVNWCRGQDLKNENGDSSTTDVRPSFYGDVLHSRPAVINYNRNCSSGANDDVYVYYGANDGMLKATKGGADTGADGGKEAWAFMPEEFIDDITALYDNKATTKKPYFVDGAIGSYIKYIPSTSCAGTRTVSEAYIYPTMRRGGNFLYGLDVSPVAGTTVPQLKYMWRISNGTAGFAQLGQTWSEPKSAMVKIGTVATPVLIFGGGYDASKEDVAEAGTARTMGAAIYVVHAKDGTLIWRASSNSTDPCPSGAVCTVVSGMTYSIPSDIAIADYDANGFSDRLYFGDTGANLWRANIASTDVSQWNLYKLAQFNTARTGEGAGTNNRKILYAPDVVRAEGYVLVLAGTGDREKPFDRTIINRLYAIKDTYTGTAAPSTLPTPATDTDSNLLEVKASNISTGVKMASTDEGWFYTLTEPGEKIVSSPVTLNSTVFYNTNIPRTGCASGLGEARIYAMNYQTGKAAVYTLNGLLSFYRTVKGGGYLPGGVPAVVDIGGKLREVLIVGTKVSQDIGTVQLGRRVRTYWKKSIDQ